MSSPEVPDTGQARADRLADGIRKFADDCKLLLDFGGLDHRVARSIAQQERNLRALLAEPSGDTVQAPDVASRVDTELMLLARAIEKTAGYDNDVQAPWVVERIGLIRALLGTDTTPDRLAWISEAGETAAVERQARYQETACARRPDEQSGDTDPLRASGRRFCEGDCSCGHDHERHGPEAPGCIECSCRITPEARQ